jgi:hypothetical protein
MRTAVLVVGYITLALMVITCLSSAGNPELSSEQVIDTFIGLTYLAPSVILSIVYAHKNRDKE